MTEKEKSKEESKKKTVEDTGPYYPGIVVASREQLLKSKGGISSFNVKTGKTDKQ